MRARFRRKAIEQLTVRLQLLSAYMHIHPCTVKYHSDQRRQSATESAVGGRVTCRCDGFRFAGPLSARTLLRSGTAAIC